MTGTEPIGSIDYTALMLATEACAVGDALVYDATLGYYRVATASHRASAYATTEAIARQAYGGSEVGKVKFQTAGVMSQAVSGLEVLEQTLEKKLVRVSTTGRLERVDAYTDGDDIVGYAHWNGRVALHIGLPWQLIASYAGGIAGTPDYSIQYRKADGTFGGAAHASISQGVDGGYIETRSASESVHSTAHWRVGWISATLLGFLDDVGTDRNLIGLSTASGPIFGSSAKQTSIFGSVFTLVTSGGATYTSSLHSFSCGGERVRIDSATNYCGVPRYGLNTAWGASEGEVTLGNTGTYSLTNAQYSLASIVLSGAATGTYTFPAPTAAKSYFKFLQETGGYDKVITIGSGTTYTLKADTSMWLKFTDLGVFAPTVGGSRPTKIVTGTGDLGTIDLNVGGELAETIIFVGDTGTPDDVEVRGFTAPPSGESRRIVIISALAGESTTLTLQDTAADDTDDYMYLPTTTVAIANDGRRGYGLVYNENFPGWVLEGAP